VRGSDFKDRVLSRLVLNISINWLDWSPGVEITDLCTTEVSVISKLLCMLVTNIPLRFMIVKDAKSLQKIVTRNPLLIVSPARASLPDLKQTGVLYYKKTFYTRF